MSVIHIRPRALSVVRSTVVCVTSIAALAMLGLSGNAIANELVVTPRSLEHEEGNSEFFSLPGAPPNGFRAQWPYLASDFSELPDGHNTIVSMAWRPDHDVNILNTYTVGLELRLSTTSAAPGTLSNSFAMNTGADERTVYSGPITLATDGAGAPNGPRAFDYLIEFQEPFVYDPNQGNLLVDFSFLQPAEGTLYADIHETSPSLIQSVGALDGSALTATASDRRVLVTQFEFVPATVEKNCDYDSDGSCDIADIDMLVAEIFVGTADKVNLAEWLSAAAQENGLSSPYLLGDADLSGTVNANDLNAMALNWQKNVATWSGGDFTASGRVDAADLNALALNWQQSSATSAASEIVPEPGGFGVVILAFGTLWLVFRATLSRAVIRNQTRRT